MTDADASETLRERTRRAVQSELLDAGQRLFAERGYEAVTVDEIASAVGMSKRSFFRYFGSKEALMLGKYDRQGEAFAAALAARPTNEPSWIALRRMFDGVVAYISDPELARRAAELDRVINSSETLRAGYLERMDRGQRLIVEELGRRARSEGGANTGVNTGQDEAANTAANAADGDLGRAAMVAAAFAALSTAHRYARANALPLGETLDEAMAAVAAVATPSIHTV